MFNVNLINALSVRLNELFGGSHEIYADESVKQGMTEPCFFIQRVTGSRVAMLGARSHRVNSFVIHYFPDLGGEKIKLEDAADILLEGLVYITAKNGDVFRGTSMRYEVVDDVLHFFVNYNFHTLRTEAKEKMEELKEAISIG